MSKLFPDILHPRVVSKDSLKHLLRIGTPLALVLLSYFAGYTYTDTRAQTSGGAPPTQIPEPGGTIPTPTPTETLTPEPEPLIDLIMSELYNQDGHVSGGKISAVKYTNGVEEIIFDNNNMEETPGPNGKVIDYRGFVPVTLNEVRILTTTVSHQDGDLNLNTDAIFSSPNFQNVKIENEGTTNTSVSTAITNGTDSVNAANTASESTAATDTLIESVVNNVDDAMSLTAKGPAVDASIEIVGALNGSLELNATSIGAIKAAALNELQVIGSFSGNAPNGISGEITHNGNIYGFKTDMPIFPGITQEINLDPSTKAVYIDIEHDGNPVEDKIEPGQRVKLPITVVTPGLTPTGESPQPQVTATSTSETQQPQLTPTPSKTPEGSSNSLFLPLIKK